MSKGKEHTGVFLALSAAAIIALLFLWKRKLIREDVTTVITYQGEELKPMTYAEMLAKMLPNEFINSSGKLCSSFLGNVTCFGGNPEDVLLKR